ncbi:hypothetical protein M5C97_19360 [Acidovorax sp. NCPPB 3859]|nr:MULTISPECIES: hypothetical protein [unclassified Acidovorax]MDA8453086.1 hypothetical protein [Acidovorax sp. GBBC 3297]MDA8462494.1 hypothetical protein [Acidovorax sp. GBBC 3333]MDA8467532.1 hypothetical protein [Acidovorax sp. GBBC 3332]MDA8472566.1 hypothetical protein [Acidovorax sp. GBBC 3299]WCM77650.1 hypothetical protein M5C94_19310 [Acidovorax sp. GBBC 712]
MSTPKTDDSPRFARIPSFSMVIDALASALGIARNKADGLALRRTFDGRISAYSGDGGSQGLGARILDALAGDDTILRDYLKNVALDLEEDLTNARAEVLLAQASEEEGYREFVQLWVVPKATKILLRAPGQTGAPMHVMRSLLTKHSQHQAQTSFQSTWKHAMRDTLVQDSCTSEFRATLDKLDGSSQRKSSSIEADLAQLKDALSSYTDCESELTKLITHTRLTYYAGMIILRFRAMASDLGLNGDALINSVAASLAAVPEIKHCTNADASDEWLTSFYERVRGLRSEPAWLETLHNALALFMRDLNDASFKDDLDEARRCAFGQPGLPLIDAIEAKWHIYRGRFHVAAPLLRNIASLAEHRQIGGYALYAASSLIAMRIMDVETLRSTELNPLVILRIESLPLSITFEPNEVPSVFKTFTPRPVLSSYDEHVLKSVALFNEIPRALCTSGTCNPLAGLDQQLHLMVERSKRPGASLNAKVRRAPAIRGTSVPPYEALKFHIYFWSMVMDRRGENRIETPGLEYYSSLGRDDQLRVLRYIDADRFAQDLEAYSLADWRHPDDEG